MPLSEYIQKIPSVFYYIKHFGVLKTIRGFYFYHYRIFKRRNLELDVEKKVSVNGYEMFVIPNDRGISEELQMFHTHEPLNTRLFCNELKKGMTCIDLGSNIGYYACLESNLIGKDGNVYAIEPSPTNFEYLKKNAHIQKFANINTYNFACAEKEGTLHLLVDDFSNLSRVVTNDHHSTKGKIIAVPSKPLDLFIKENQIDKVDLIRMDVEGYEDKILNGMKDTIKKFKPILQIEVHPMYLGNEKTKEFLQHLKSNGYDVLYYIAREMDLSLICEDSDIKHPSIDELIKSATEGKLPIAFLTLFKKT